MIEIYHIYDDYGYHYIGKSVDSKRRLRAHIYSGQHPEIYGEPSPCDYWLANLDHEPHLEIIEVCTLETWREAEIKWIAEYRRIYGWDKVKNVTAGGESSFGEDNPNAKLTWDEVYLIRELDLRKRDIIKYFGLSKTQARRIRANTAWYDPEYEPYPEKHSTVSDNPMAAQTTREDQLAMYQLRYDFKDGYSIKELAESYFPHLSQKSAEKKVRKILRGDNYQDPDWDPEVDYPGRRSTRKRNRTIKENKL